MGFKSSVPGLLFRTLQRGCDIPLPGNQCKTSNPRSGPKPGPVEAAYIGEARLDHLVSLGIHHSVSVAALHRREALAEIRDLVVFGGHNHFQVAVEKAPQAVFRLLKGSQTATKVSHPGVVQHAGNDFPSLQVEKSRIRLLDHPNQSLTGWIGFVKLVAQICHHTSPGVDDGKSRQFTVDQRPLIAKTRSGAKPGEISTRLADRQEAALECQIGVKIPARCVVRDHRPTLPERSSVIKEQSAREPHVPLGVDESVLLDSPSSRKRDVGPAFAERLSRFKFVLGHLATQGIQKAVERLPKPAHFSQAARKGLQIGILKWNAHLSRRMDHSIAPFLWKCALAHQCQWWILGVAKALHPIVFASDHKVALGIAKSPFPALIEGDQPV